MLLVKYFQSVAKLLSIFYGLFYTLLCLLTYKSDHAVTFLTATLVAASVSGCTLYAVFKWSKMCLIPFLLLQVVSIGLC